jgi:hypothetical protein
MATRRLGNVHQEVEEVRSRLFLKRWDTIHADVGQRIYGLGKLIDTPAGAELHRHVIVSSIAALQTYHRGTIVSVVNSGDLYKERAAEKLTEKFSMKDALTWLSGKTVSFGELVAHSAPCNSVTDMLSWLEILLACDMRQAMAVAIHPADRRRGIENAAVLVPDVDMLLKELANAFRLRHIFAHEAAPNLIVTADECRSMLKSVSLWVQAVDAVLWDTAYADLPLMQSEMTQHAQAEVQAAKKDLAIVLRKALTFARAEGSADWLRQNHFAWMKVTMEWKNSTYDSLQGTMWPSIALSDLAVAIRARTEQLENWVRWQQPEMSSEY